MQDRPTRSTCESLRLNWYPRGYPPRIGDGSVNNPSDNIIITAWIGGREIVQCLLQHHHDTSTEQDPSRNLGEVEKT